MYAPSQLYSNNSTKQSNNNSNIMLVIVSLRIATATRVGEKMGRESKSIRGLMLVVAAATTKPHAQSDRQPKRPPKSKPKGIETQL
jgi:hypothetical protein